MKGNQRLGRWAPTTSLLLRSCGATRKGRLRWPGQLRQRSAPYSQGQAWRAMRDRSGRGGALGAWRVAPRSSAGCRTTRRNGLSVGCPGCIAGMEPAARSCSSPPLRGAPPVFIPTRIETRVQANSKARSNALGPTSAQEVILGYKCAQGGFEGTSVGKEVTIGRRKISVSVAKYRPHRPHPHQCAGLQDFLVPASCCGRCGRYSSQLS